MRRKSFLSLQFAERIIMTAREHVKRIVSGNSSECCGEENNELTLSRCSKCFPAALPPAFDGSQAGAAAAAAASGALINSCDTFRATLAPVLECL